MCCSLSSVDDLQCLICLQSLDLRSNQITGTLSLHAVYLLFKYLINYVCEYTSDIWQLCNEQLDKYLYSMSFFGRIQINTLCCS